MNSLKYLLAIGALTAAFVLPAQAHLEFQGAIGKADVGNNSPAADLIALGIVLDQDVSNFTLCGNFEDVSGDTNIDVMPGSYLVVHYGKGKGGTSKGGGLEVFLVAGGETNVTVPGTGTSAFGKGGISSIREFCPPGTNMPDSGTTAMLLGSALTGLGLVLRYLKR
jgi:hypothetical protein